MKQALVSFFMEDLAAVPIKNKREIKIMDTRGYVKFWWEYSCFLALENIFFFPVTESIHFSLFFFLKQLGKYPSW